MKKTEAIAEPGLDFWELSKRKQDLTIHRHTHSVARAVPLCHVKNATLEIVQWSNTDQLL